ncbi:MAG: hypothetical protein CPDRYMAC_5884 [uncultured Paraburkholderia sp.]|nr:MAG: hypothetical protein CPDRYDRY_5829 [uncultured Paraburkholderia sp.]CAH2942794.1 MAG: hypothetical protein CPDRYMAC_5884 [uncultured Paraburkholderia sp.]
MTKVQQTDLHPGDEQLVTIFTWPYPAIQPKMAAGTSAKGWYGGVKVSVSATDMPVVTRTFDFDYTKEPMLFDPLPDGQNDPTLLTPSGSLAVSSPNFCSPSKSPTAIRRYGSPRKSTARG